MQPSFRLAPSLVLGLVALVSALIGLPGSVGSARASSVMWDAPSRYEAPYAPRYERRVVAPRKAARSRIAAKRWQTRHAKRLRAQAYRQHQIGSRSRVARHSLRQNASRQTTRTRTAAFEQIIDSPSLTRRGKATRQVTARQIASLGDIEQNRRDRASIGRVEAHVDIRSQRMVVKVDGEVRHVWKVSTGRKGFVTPRGVYGPQRMHARYFSRKYYNSPMPYSIFFRGGYAVHGTTAINRLGGPASHGCVRLATANARTLFHLVQASGRHRTRIIIT